MKRQLFQTLLDWKNQKKRKPLLLRGARQVGKTYLVREFARASFENVVEVNFELQPELKTVFDHPDPVQIIKKLNTVLETHIQAGRTILFLDEIQACPQAIQALRFFCEQMPDLHIVSAGSLLEFVLKSQEFSMPVGRVQYLFMKPVSFSEYLLSCGHEQLLQYLRELKVPSGLDESVHQALVKHFRDYVIVGGMPEAVAQFLDANESGLFPRVHLSLLQTFRDDFGKYAKGGQVGYLQKIFAAVPKMVGNIFKFSHVDSEIQSRELKQALNLLVRAGVVTRVAHVSGQGVPLIEKIGEKIFKALFLDVGLMQKSCGLDAQLMMQSDVLQVNSGSVAEQFVGQEILSGQDPFEEPALYFWCREKKNAQAELDYLLQLHNHVIPVEVKAGSTGRLKSLHVFLKEHPQSPLGIRFSQIKEISYHEKILSLPIYAVSQMPRLVAECIER